MSKKVRLLTSYTGIGKHFGAIVELADDVAQRYVEWGHAEIVGEGAKTAKPKSGSKAAQRKTATKAKRETR